MNLLGEKGGAEDGGDDHAQRAESGHENRPS